MNARTRRIPLALFSLALALACAQSRPRESAAPHALTADEERAVHALLQSFGADGPLSPRLEERVAFHLAKLRQRDPGAIAERQKQVWPIIAGALAAEKLPEWLGAMAYVESRFEPGVRGGAACAGLWQFTAPTARRFGLRVDEGAAAQPDLVDERLDPEKSSRAAARYLATLIDEFGRGSFLLALASYNAGETKVHAAVAQSSAAGGESPGDFWTLDERGLFSEETSNYVPRVLAAALVFAAPR